MQRPLPDTTRLLHRRLIEWLAAGAVLSACWPAAALAQSGSGATGPGTPVVVIASAVFGALAAGVLLALCYRRRGSLRRNIFSAVPTPRQIVSDRGHGIEANPAFRQFFGDTRKAIPQLLCEKIGDDREALELIERLDANARGGVSGWAKVRLPARARTVEEPAAKAGPSPNKRFDWCYVAAYPFPDRPGWTYWELDDISPRRGTAQSLGREQESFVPLFEDAPIGFYSLNADGRFLFVNRTLRDWLGLPKSQGELAEVRLHDLIADALPDGCEAYNPFGNPDLSFGNVTLRRRDGSTFEALIGQDLVRDADGRLLRTRTVVRDLSRERAMADAAETYERRFERFFQDAPVGIALIDPSGEISECNAEFRALVGLEERSPKHQRFLDLVFEADRAAVGPAIGLRPNGAGPANPASPLEVRFGPNGETICSMYVTRSESKAGKPSGHIAHFINSTEQKSLEAQVTQSQKMQAVGQLAGGIAHDFNNLLTAMIGFCDLLLLRHRPGDQSFADIMQIQQNANRAANLVRQLLAFSRQQTLQPRKLNVTDILAELSHLLRRLIGGTIELKMNHGRDLGLVRADQGQLEQVIINLAVNARDAMSEDGAGVLSIRTSNEKVQTARRFKGEMMPPGDYVLIEVTDTGSGIAPEHLDRIFDPFFSTKEVGQGTGLGLSTVYGIVKQSGGYIFVDSKPGEGSVFSIYLPHDRSAETEAESGPERRAGRDLTGVGTLLLVEDEDAVRAFGARALMNKGYKVLEASSGESALDVLRNERTPIDLLITDVAMPHMDGPTLVKELRGQRPDLKVIFISGYAEDLFRRRIGEESGIHFLQKPFSLKQLAGKVKEVLAQ